jgi:hypothetical protein
MPREGFGYISRQVGVQEPPAYRQCTWYEASEKDTFFQGDGMWHAGMAMSLLAVGVGFVVMCVVLCTCCVAFELPTFDGLFWTCLLCFVAQSLTFLSWGSNLCDEYECTWSSGTGMNITAAMFWVWAANMIKSFPEALPPPRRGPRQRHNNGKHRRPINDDDDGAEDSPYLNNNTNRGFQDEYNEGDEFQDWNEDDEFDDRRQREQQQQQGYYDENGDWHEPEDPEGYYDDDGNWYQYDDGLEANGAESSYNGSYYGQDGDDPLQPTSNPYRDDEANNDAEDDEPNPDDLLSSNKRRYKYPNASRTSMSKEEMEFMAESQRTMNTID